jgi:predicted TIM-barrel fold metal-dependent hydrolase
VARTADLLSNGVLASITFPTLPKFAGVLFAEFEDKALADVCVKAYNDFMLDEWCPAGPPGLFVPTVMCQLWDPVLAAQEIRRTAARGARALTFPENTAPLGLPSYWTDHWEPVWDAAEETGIVLCLHIGTSGQFPAPSPEAPESLGFSLLSTQSYAAAVNLMWSPVCRRHPKLKFVFAEGGIGWLPTALENSDHKWKTDKPYRGFDDTLPSEIFRQNMWLCMMEEPVALTYRDAIGIDKIMWECDFPHPDSLWPRSQELTAGYFTAARCTDDEIEQISHRNAESVFDWKIASPELLATGAVS